MSSAVGKTPRPATEADLLALPEEGRGWELMGGELVEKHAGFRHGHAQGSLNGILHPFRRGGGSQPGGWWLLTEQLVRLSPDTVRPDVTGWRRENMPVPPQGKEAIVTVRPDWICEIISPGHAARDHVTKRRLYFQHAVPAYWIIDPRDETLTVHRWSAAGYVTVLAAQRGDVVRAEPFDLVEVVVAELFVDGDAEPTT